MAVLYVAGESSELQPFANLLTGLRKLKWPIDYAWEGIWQGRRLVLAANGAGPKLAAQAVEIAIRAVTAAELSSSKLEAVISVGYCGALDPSLAEGQIVAATDVLDLATGAGFACVPIVADRPFATGQIVSQNSVAIDSVAKKKLNLGGATAVEMEAAGVAARAGKAGLPFSCIKVVTDRADESFGIDLNEMRTSEGRIARGKIGLYAITHPKVIPELVRLRRRAKDAAGALGEFLVNCRMQPGDRDTTSE